jgi:hypothetical protein
VLIEPLNSLKESLLLGKSLSIILKITAHSKSVLNVRVKVDLERFASLDKNLLGAVSLLGGENAVGLRRCDGQGSFNGSEFIFLDERGVSDIADLDALLVVANNVLFLLASVFSGGVMLGTYLGAEAVSDTSDLVKTLILKILDRLNNNRVNLGGSMRVIAIGTVHDPAHDVDAHGRVFQDIAVEKVGNDGSVPVGSELVCHELAVVPDTKDISDVNNSSALVSLALGGGSNVSLDTAGKLDHLSSGLAPTNCEYWYQDDG